MDDFKQGFEDFMKDQNPKVDLVMSQNSSLYINPGVQTAWIGYQVLHSGLFACADDNGATEERNDESEG